MQDEKHAGLSRAKSARFGLMLRGSPASVYATLTSRLHSRFKSTVTGTQIAFHESQSRAWRRNTTLVECDLSTHQEAAAGQCRKQSSIRTGTPGATGQVAASDGGQACTPRSALRRESAGEHGTNLRPASSRPQCGRGLQQLELRETPQDTARTKGTIPIPGLLCDRS